MKPFVPNASLGLNDATRIPSAAIFIVFASWPLTMTVAPTPGGASAMARPVVRLLSENGYDGKLVLFNGSNADQQFKMIYENWSERNKGTDRSASTSCSRKDGQTGQLGRGQESVRGGEIIRTGQDAAVLGSISRRLKNTA